MINLSTKKTGKWRVPALLLGALFIAGCQAPREFDYTNVDVSVLEGLNIRTLHAAYMNFNRDDGVSDIIRITTPLVEVTQPLTISGSDDFEIIGDTKEGAVKLIAAADGHFINIKAAPNQRIIFRNLLIVPDFHTKTSPKSAFRLITTQKAINHETKFENITVTASLGETNTPASSSVEFSKNHRHFLYGLYSDSFHRENSPTKLIVEKSSFLHSERSNICLSTQFNLETRISGSSLDRAGICGMQLENINNLQVQLDDTSIDHNGAYGLYYRNSYDNAKVELNPGTTLNHNGRCGILVHGGGRGVKSLIIKGSRSKPVETVDNQQDGIRFTALPQGEAIQFGPVENWVVTNNFHALNFNATNIIRESQIGPFKSCLFANNRSDAIVWRIGEITTQFVDCTFANNGGTHSLHKDAGRKLGAPNTITFKNCLFAGPNTDTAAMDADNGDKILFENCALVTEGPSALKRSPPYTTNGPAIIVKNCVFQDPEFVSTQTNPCKTTSFAVDNAVFQDKADNGKSLSGWGRFFGRDKTSLPHYQDSLAWFDSRQENEPDYKKYLIDNVPLPPLFTLQKDKKYGACHARTALVYMFLYEWTGKKEYATTALEIFQALIDHWDDQNDSAALLPFMETYQKLQKAGMIDVMVLQDKTRHFVIEKFVPKERGDNALAACRMAGLAKAQEVFPALPTTKTNLNYINAVWHDWYTRLDTTENSHEQNGLFWFNILKTAQIMKWENRLKKPGVKNVFERYIDTISPAGALPGVGIAPPVVHSPVWVCVFEQMATLLNAPTLRWAAWKMLPLLPIKLTPDAPEEQRCALLNSLYYYCYASLWKTPDLSPTAPMEEVALMEIRKNKAKEDIIDKIILGKKSEKSPFLLLELFGTNGAKGHPEWGSIEYFEYNNTPLLRSAGASSYSPALGNIVLIRPEKDGFPHKTILYKPNTWYEALLPLNMLWPKDTPPAPPEHQARLDAKKNKPKTANTNPNLRHMESLMFQVENDTAPSPQDNQPFHFYLDNLRLFGPAGERTLDDFEVSESLLKWNHRHPLTISNDAAQGAQSMKAQCKNGLNLISRKFDVDWNKSDYTHLRFDWKIDAKNTDKSCQVYTRLSDQGLTLKWWLPELQYAPEIQLAKVESQGDDCYAETKLNSYFTPSTTLTRQIILTKEGVLVVCDTVNPGRDANNREAGPVWHMWTRPGSRGENWFDAAGDPKLNAQDMRLFVFFEKSESRTYGVQTVSLNNGDQVSTIFTKQKLSVRLPVTFISVLIPHKPDVDPVGLADAISIRNIPTATKQIDIQTQDGSTLNIFIDTRQTKWRVER